MWFGGIFFPFETWLLQPLSDFIERKCVFAETTLASVCSCQNRSNHFSPLSKWKNGISCKRTKKPHYIQTSVKMILISTFTSCCHWATSGKILSLLLYILAMHQIHSNCCVVITPHLHLLSTWPNLHNTLSYFNFFSLQGVLCSGSCKIIKGTFNANCAFHVDINRVGLKGGELFQRKMHRPGSAALRHKQRIWHPIKFASRRSLNTNYWSSIRSPSARETLISSK